jgi:hypothetical protein
MCQQCRVRGGPGSDRAGELAALRAVGWTDGALARLVGYKGAAIGVLGAAIGSALGLGGAAWLVGDVPGTLILVAGAAAAGGILATGAHGMTILLATHEQHLAARCDRLIRISDGKVLEDIDLTRGEGPEATLDRASRLRL